MHHIKISDNLSLPVDVACQTILTIGKRGSGKSSTARRFAEQFHAAGVPFVVIDPADNWFGLKASRSGGPGLPVYVFGGRHADLPLEATAGALMADVAVDHRIPMVLSVRHFTGGEKNRFVEEFCTRLFKRNSDPIHIFLEEAQNFAPERYKGEERMLGAVIRLWKEGRSSGIAGTAISQRPASLSKNVTTQSEILIVHRTIGPQDVAAIREWIRYHGEREDILSQLSTLKTGEAFIWAPEFPENKPIGLRRIQILAPETFDSSATPKIGAKAHDPESMATVDLDKLRERMAGTIERARGEDPKELRKQIYDLRQENKSLKEAKAPEKIKEVPVISKEQEDRLVAAIGALSNLRTTLQEAMQSLPLGINGAEAIAKQISDAVKQHVHPKPVWDGVRPKAHLPPQGSFAGLRLDGKPLTLNQYDPGKDVRIGLGERKCLTAVAQHQNGVTREQLTILTGYKRSTRDAYLQRLGTKGLTMFNGDGQVLATREGYSELGGAFEPLPTGDMLRDYWTRKLPEGECKIFSVVVDHYPNAVTRDDISRMTDFKRSTRDAYIQRLSTRKLVKAWSNGIIAAKELFG